MSFHVKNRYFCLNWCGDVIVDILCWLFKLRQMSLTIFAIIICIKTNMSFSSRKLKGGFLMLEPRQICRGFNIFTHKKTSMPHITKNCLPDNDALMHANTHISTPPPPPPPTTTTTNHHHHSHHHGGRFDKICVVFVILNSRALWNQHYDLRPNAEYNHSWSVNFSCTFLNRTRGDYMAQCSCWYPYQ